jgi:rhodanese-related sulfurtransferase
MTTVSPAVSTSAVLATRPANPEEAHRYFGERLRYETDVADVASDVRSGAVPYTIVDVRSPEDYSRGHVLGAVSLPLRAITKDTVANLPEGLLVVYCWGPSCNGAHRGAYRLTRHGRQVKEMIGGFEYWVREGQPVAGDRAELLAGLSQPDLVGGHGPATPEAATAASQA